MTRTKRMALAAGIVGMMLLLVTAACEKRTAVRPQAPEPKAEVAAAAEAPKELPIYQRDIKPLPTEQCARCHVSVFQNLKAVGGKHQIDCTRCHVQFHVYNPRTSNYADIMPKCAACHKSSSGGAFHGDDPGVTNCLTCHADPHRPNEIPMSGVQDQCGKCHAKEAKEVAGTPSAHATAVSCADCHSGNHGHIPQCADCHSSHSPTVSMQSKDCMSCHPVHSPTRIAYANNTDSGICAGCHQGVATLLKNNVTKHTEVLCVRCHPKHKEVEPCSACHGQPHNTALMRDTSRCNECHGKAHNLAAN